MGYVPTPSPIEAQPAIRAYLEREFRSIARALGVRGAQVNVLDDFGAAGDGVTDDAGAIQSAIDAGGRRIYLPAGTYLLGSELATDDAVPVLIYGDGPQTRLVKGFDGDMLSLGLKSEIASLHLDGNGANFTGRGIIIETGSGGDGWQSIRNLTILDTLSHCVEYTAVGAGWASIIDNCRLGVYGRPAVYAVKYPDDPGSLLDNGPRILTKCRTVGPLADMAGAAECMILDNIGGEDLAQTVPTITMAVDSHLCIVEGNSLVANVRMNIRGDRNIIVGNMTRGGYELVTGATNCRVAHNWGTAPEADFDVDSSGSVSNELYGIAHSYTPTVTASGTAFALGDGTIAGRWQRYGRRVHVQIDLLMGATTTFGTGTYTFSLPPGVPAPGNGTSIGAVQCIDSGTTNRIGVPVIPANSGIQCVIDGELNAVGATNPFTFAAGDRIRIDATYNL